MTFKGMMTAMAPDEPSSIQTRPSLLNRLKSGDDAESWQAFYRIYGKLVRDFSIQAGLTDTEADEVVQETAIATARHLPEYRYDPKVCRFKTWLHPRSAQYRRAREKQILISWNGFCAKNGSDHRFARWRLKSAATVCLLLEQFSLLTLIRRRPSRVAGRMHPHHRARPRPRRRNLDPGAHPQRPRQPGLCPVPRRDCPDLASRHTPRGHPTAGNMTKALPGRWGNQGLRQRHQGRLKSAFSKASAAPLGPGCRG